MVDYLQDGTITYMMWECRFVGVACVFMLLFFFVQVCVSSQQGVCLPMKEGSAEAGSASHQTWNGSGTRVKLRSRG